MLKIHAYFEFIDLCVFEIFDHKNADFVARLLGTVVVMATIFCPTRWGVVLMLTSTYELDRTTQYWVIEIFNLICYVFGEGGQNLLYVFWEGSNFKFSLQI